MKPFRFACRLLMPILFGVIGMLSASAQPLQITGTDFGQVDCGTKQCIPVTFMNTTAASVSLDAMNVPGPLFTFEPPAPVTFPVVLAPNVPQTFRFCYSPTTAPANDQVTVTLTLDGAANAQSFILRGTSVAPQMQLNPTSLDFGAVTVGSNRDLTVDIMNTGTAPMTVGAITGINPPYSILNPPAAPIAPGASVTVTIRYTPTAQGTDATTGVFPFTRCGANQSQSLPITGTGAQIPAFALGPVLEITNATTDYDTTMCGTIKCRNLTIRNTGSDVANIVALAPQLTPPFSFNISTPFSTPFQIPGNNGERTFSVCYNPLGSDVSDSQSVTLIADNRVSLSISLVFDRSGSMVTAVPNSGGRNRTQVGHDGGVQFVNDLVNDPGRGIIDEANVISFSDNITENQGYTSVKASLIGAIPTTNGGTTNLWGAVVQSAQGLCSRNQSGRRVIILLTDGDNTGSTSLNQAIQVAQTCGIRVFTIGLGADISSTGRTALQDLATQTGGSSFVVNSEAELRTVYRQIANSLSRNIPITLNFRGSSVAPRFSFIPTTINFDSIRVGQSFCRDITIRNIGSAPGTMNAGMFTLSNPQFTLQNVPAAAILPGQFTSMQVCFAPTRLREQDGTGSLTYNTCRVPIDLNFSGVGYDSVIVELTENVTGRHPGDTITVPVLLQNNIPAIYGVDSMKIALRYNKTMMSPLAATSVQTGGTLASVMGTTSVSSVFEASDAVATFSLSGGTLVNTAPNSRLVNLRFLVLQGNAMTTPIALSSVQLADGNPKTGLIQPGSLALDTLCYQARRLFDPSARIAGATLKQVLVDRTGSAVTARFTMQSEGEVMLLLFDRLGRLIRTEGRVHAAAGDNELRMDVSDLSIGSYVLRLESGGMQDNAVIMLIK